MSFSDQILSYYRILRPPENLPAEVNVMNPYSHPETSEVASRFYRKFYTDDNPRFICFGINPGRFGAGVTGVPFTDPVRLQEVCGIPNDLSKKAELSSKFIYEMIDAYGGPKSFFDKYYISAVSPLGYILDGINLNYYDIKGYKRLFEEYVVREINKQLEFNINRKAAFSIGKGENAKYLKIINDKHGFFGEIISLSHPRWVMQYRLKRKDEFIQGYLDAFRRVEERL